MPTLESRLERLAPSDPGRAALLHDLLAGEASPAGREALDALMSEPHVRSAPPLAQPDPETALPILVNALDKLEARRAARVELARAEAEMAGLVDEGLTWRVAQLAHAREAADRVQMTDTADLGEDEEALSANLAAAISAEIWRKRR